MPTTQTAVFRSRPAAALPFLLVALLAIVAGGLVAAVMAHAPSRALMWMVAYLVLVAGVAQAGFGVGQAWLAPVGVPVRRVLLQCGFFNLGNAGVIVGTLVSAPSLVMAGTISFVLALLMFLAGTRGARAGWPLLAYRIGLGLIALGAAIGVLLSLVRSSV